jgi:addiction module RelB/DinJ family antitoxin
MIMAQVSMTVRMDYELKKMFDSLCAQVGISANAAMNVFAKAVVQRRCIPFEIRADEPAYTQKGLNSFYELRNIACDSGVSDMTLEEINAEIAGYRTERKKK